MKIFCLFKHNWLNYTPVCCRFRRECKRCGKIETHIIDTVHKSVEFFGNYDKAIDWCVKHQIEK